MSHYHNLICTTCYAERIPPARARLGYMTCLSCGEKAASKVRHTVVNLNKSNYMLFTDLEQLKQTNPKRTI
jgi:DNA-directed RNA polymerase subunit RPC12/RpoP